MNDDYYHCFKLQIKRHHVKNDEIPFGERHVKFVRAILEKRPCVGRDEDVIFEGKIREVKQKIKIYWDTK